MSEPIDVAPLDAPGDKLNVEQENDLKSIIRDPVEGGKGGIIEVDLPGSLYSCLMIIPLCTNIGENRWQNTMVITQIMFLHAINMYVQANILWSVYEIYKVNNAEFGECGGYEVEFTLRSLCVLIYTTLCIGDFTESLKMLMFTINFKTCKTFQPLKYELTIQDGQDEISFATGMTRAYKIYICCAVLFPKFVIALWLLVWGTGFVVTTNDPSDVVLNALALGFVLELDEMIYDLLPSQMIEIIEELPSVPLARGKLTSWNKEYGMFVKGFGIGILTYCTYMTFCPNQPE